MNAVKSPFSLLTITLIFLSILFIRFSNPNWGKHGDFGILAWDNFGYYLYLPATFIYDDPGIENLEWVNTIREKYKPSTTFYQAHKVGNERHVIQYSMGMAIIYSPAFLIGHSYALLSNKFPADGFSQPYQLAVLVQSILLVLLGLVFIRLFALHFFNDKIAAFTIIFLCLGTNYFQITTTNTTTPHSLLFTFYAFLLLMTAQWYQRQEFRKTILIGCVLAIMVLSRPNELIFLIIPLLWNVYSIQSFKLKISFLLKKYHHILIIGFILLIIGCLQLFYWKYTTGKWIYDSYTNEDFKLFNPYLKEYLFSYKKGWLIYTPIMILALLGFISLYRRNRKLFFPFLLFTVFNIWILSSWDNWWYADSFSQRSIVQSYPIFVLPIGYLFMDIFAQKTFIKYTAIVLLFGFIILNLFQTYQSKKGIIHSQRMTKKYYWAIFGDFTYNSEKAKLLDIDRDLNVIQTDLPTKHYLVFHENFNENKSDEKFQFEGKFYPKEGMFELNQNNNFSKKISFAYNQLTDSNYVYAIARLRYLSNFDAKENPFSLVITTEDSYSKKNYKYIQQNIEDEPLFEKSKWNIMELIYVPPYLRSKKDSLHVYIWHRGSKKLLIDNFSLEIYDPGNKTMFNKKTYINNFSSLKIGNWSNSIQLVSNKQYSVVNKSAPYSSTLYLPYADIPDGGSKFKISCIGLSTSNNDKAAVVLSIEKGAEKFYYSSFPLINSESEWKNYRFEGIIPDGIPMGSELKFYIWNDNDMPFFVDELRLDIE